MNNQQGCQIQGKVDISDTLRSFVSGNASNPIVILQGTTVVAANEAWAGLFGYKDVNESVNTTLADILCPESLRVAEQRIAERASGRLAHDSQVYDCVGVDGRPLRVEVVVIPWPVDMELTIAIVRDVTQRERVEQRLTRLNECMLSFGADPVANINSLVLLCGELMSAECAFYYCAKEGGLVDWHDLCVGGKAEEPTTATEGLICHEVIRNGGEDVLVVHDLPNTSYVRTDYRVADMGLQTYVGRAVKFGGQCIGVLSVVYKGDYIPTEDDDRLMGAIAGAISIEEERKHSMDALRRSEERFRHVLDSSRDGIFRIDIRNRCYDYLSPSVIEYLGYTEAEILEMGTTGIWYRLNPEDRERLAQKVLSMLDLPPDQELPTLEYRFKHRDGRVIWISDNRTIIRDENGEPIACVGNIRNVTEQKRAEEALRESENRYRGLVESQQDLIVRVTPDGMFTFVNDVYCRMFGKSREQLLGTSFVPLVHEEDLPGTLDEMEKLDVPPYRVYIEQRAMTVQGWRWLAWEDCAIHNEHGEIVEIQAVGRDITERKKADEALRKAYDDLTKAYELQREFLNNVTHEVRTPLVAVKGYVDMLLEGVFGTLTTEQADLLRKVLTSSNHLLDIVGGVLEMARLKSGALAVKSRVCRLSTEITRAIDTVSAQAAQKGVYVRFHPIGADCLGLYDDDKVRIILHNLLSNAVKFTMKGGVDIYADCDKSRTEIIVVDSGIGIDEDELGSIFAEFKQLDYPGKHKPTGFGLGLAITSAMVKITGSSLTVSSVKGLGTAFTLQIPAITE